MPSHSATQSRARMARNTGTPDHYSCSNGLLLPLINEFTWSVEVRAFLYLLGMLYCFTGVAIIAEIFMSSIEKITSATRKIYVHDGDPLKSPRVVKVRIWNETVANITLMALGSSASEILLSIIELIGNRFNSGELGPGAIVGAAAFNLLTVTATCIMSVPSAESRRIKGLRVFAVNTIFSITAYLWLIIVLIFSSKNVVEVWEAAVTLLLFPVMVLCAFLADKGLPCWKKKSRVRQMKAYEGQGGSSSTSDLSYNKDPEAVSGKSDGTNPGSNSNIAVLGSTDDDQHESAELNGGNRSRAWYRIRATRALSGRQRIRNRKSDGQVDTDAGVRQAVNIGRDSTALETLVPNVHQAKNKAFVEFKSLACTVPESIGRFPVSVVRHGRLDMFVKVRAESTSGSAIAGKDFIAVNEIINFGPGETRKEVMISVIDDDRFAQDKQFYMRLGLVDNNVSKENVVLGRVFLMEINIMNDNEPGCVTFNDRIVRVKEGAEDLQVPVMRRIGADGEIACNWRAIGDDIIPAANLGGTVVFKHGETKRTIEIPIGKVMAVKTGSFVLELLEPTGGAELGNIKQMIVAVGDYDVKDSAIKSRDPVVEEDTSHSHESQIPWGRQFRNAMNVNGGDVDHATTMDYVLHFLTFGWKLLFALVPPVHFWGGWLAFFVSLSFIGALTALIGDFANIFGCLIGLDDVLTAITFVAIGTSLPDLFASRNAAIHEKTADSAIGNITGSNSINVFLGFGLPWLLGSIFHAAKGQRFEVQAGNLGFSITIFTIVAVLAVVILMARRYSASCGYGELGGPKLTKYVSGITLIALWLICILFSVLDNFNIIHGF